MVNYSSRGSLVGVKLGRGIPRPKWVVLIIIAFILSLINGTAFGVITFMRRTDGHNNVVQTQDGGYALNHWRRIWDGLGYRSYIGLLKVDSLGFEEWRYVYPVPYIEPITAPAEGYDGHFYVGGRTCDTNAIVDAFLMKVKSNGRAALWSYQYAGPGIDYFADIKPTMDSGCLAVGTFTTDTLPGRNIGVVRLDRNGNVKWLRVYNPKPDPELVTEASTMVLMPDNGCVVAGSIKNVVVDSVFLLVMRIDSIGNLRWAVIDTEFGELECPPAVSLTPDGNIAIAGRERIWVDTSCGYVKVFSPSGEKMRTIIAMRRNGLDTTDFVYFRSGTAAPDGGFVLVGEAGRISRYKITLLKLNANGDSVWCRRYSYSGLPELSGAGHRVITTRDGGFLVFGNEENCGNLLIKTDSLGFVEGVPGVVDDNYAWQKTDILPTMVHNVLYLSIADKNDPVSLLDIAGRKVLNLKPGMNEVHGLSPGVYFVRIGQRCVKRVVVIR